MVFVAGVDSSTQSVKIVIRDAHSGELIREGRASHPNGTEIDPVHWWDALNLAITAAGGLQDVVAISIAGQQHGLVILDESGNVLRPALLWNDTRSSDAAVELNREIPNIVDQTGLKMVASFTASKVRYIAKEEAHLLQKISAICLPHDWLSWKLTGSTNIEDIWTDRSDASGTGYYNAEENLYKLNILRQAFDVESKYSEKILRLPKVLSAQEFGSSVQNLHTKICAGAGDNAAAAFGLQLQDGDVVVSLGTSGTAFTVTNHAIYDHSGTIAGFAALTPGQYLPLVCTLNAARILDAVCELLSINYKQLEELALQAQPGANGLTLIPYFEGERTPNRPHAKGILTGLTMENNNPRDMARAYIEGMMCGLADALYALESQGVDIKRILLIGGAAKNRAVSEVASSIFAREVLLPPPAEYVANGAARQAAWAWLGGESAPQWDLGQIESVNSPAAPEVLERYRKIRDFTTNLY